jgi:hypothetical protein
MPCKLEIRGLENLGKKREHKEENVYFPTKYSRDNPEAVAAMKEFEVDGWIGRGDDLTNHHRWVRGEDGKAGARVTFTRYV